MVVFKAVELASAEVTWNFKEIGRVFVWGGRKAICKCNRHNLKHTTQLSFVETNITFV